MLQVLLSLSSPTGLARFLRPVLYCTSLVLLVVCVYCLGRGGLYKNPHQSVHIQESIVHQESRTTSTRSLTVTLPLN